MTIPNFGFDNTFAREMEGFFVPWQGEKSPAPRILQFNADLAREFGLNPDQLNSDIGAAVFAGAVAPDGASPMAQAYAGHQFGNFSPQLGDGRALLLGEILSHDGKRFDLQLKGSGRTPFSRGGDGKAVIGPVLREYLMGEAMFALGVPTTRALAAVTTGEDILRDGPKPGAVLARIASSHLRVGTFQFFAARKEWDKVTQLADYAIARHHPDLIDADDKYLKFLSAVMDSQAHLIAEWMQIGFVHGVMNTDNMTISGETIDYGPCAFIDVYDPGAVFSSIDRNGRYAFANQPAIAQWNLARLAECLLPLIDPEGGDNAVMLATNLLTGFMNTYQSTWLSKICAKIGITGHDADDNQLVADMFAAMEGQNVDFTLFFRHLADAARGNDATLKQLFDAPEQIEKWLAAWQARTARDKTDPNQRADAMDRVNPIYIPRNHLVEHALQEAEQDNLEPFSVLLETLSDPFTRRDGLEQFAMPAPNDFGPYKTFCGT